MAAGASLEVRDENGNTALHHAASYDGIIGEGHAGAALQALLDLGADPNARNASGETPWDLAEGNKLLRGTAGYWRLNEARFEVPLYGTAAGTRPNPSAAEADSDPTECEIPGFPVPDDAESLGLDWCPSSVDFQLRVFALQAAGAWCGIRGGTSSMPEQVEARHIEISAACDRLDALAGNNFGASCLCPSGYRP